jgi:hypothetical protein
MAQVPQSAGPLSFEPLAVFATRRLRESSGVAVSRAHHGVLWTHNDSGDGPFVYVTNLEGEDLGRFEVRGARAGDWEDIAIGPCPAAARACLYIGDTGDNAEHRPAAALYVVPEPDPAAAPEARRTEPAHRIVITYREGALDVEGLAVTPDGTVFLVSKGRSGPIELFRIPRDSLASDSIALAPWTTLPIAPQRNLGRLVTGAAVSPDGRTLAVRTYTEVFFLSVAAEPAGIRLRTSCWLGLREPQGEAVDFLDDSTLVLTSESALGRVGGIARVRCRMSEPAP